MVLQACEAAWLECWGVKPFKTEQGNTWLMESAFIPHALVVSYYESTLRNALVGVRVNIELSIVSGRYRVSWQHPDAGFARPDGGWHDAPLYAWQAAAKMMAIGPWIGQEKYEPATQEEPTLPYDHHQVFMTSGLGPMPASPEITDLKAVFSCTNLGVPVSPSILRDLGHAYSQMTIKGYS